jgi:hypothetical protein
MPIAASMGCSWSQWSRPADWNMMVAIISRGDACVRSLLFKTCDPDKFLGTMVDFQS